MCPRISSEAPRVRLRLQLRLRADRRVPLRGLDRPEPPARYAIGRGLVAGAGLVATSFGINYLFSARSMVLWSIDAGYHVVQFVLFGLVLGLWH
ncbi:MAG: DUF1761 domain-containing protein [Myxococcales bacterium]|nr:DUF1761 domain-containing protein [Myxococcales bacterium]